MPHKRDNVSGRTLRTLQLNDTGLCRIETIFLPNVTLQRQHYHGLFAKSRRPACLSERRKPAYVI